MRSSSSRRLIRSRLLGSFCCVSYYLVSSAAEGLVSPTPDWSPPRTRDLSPLQPAGLPLRTGESSGDAETYPSDYSLLLGGTHPFPCQTSSSLIELSERVVAVIRQGAPKDKTALPLAPETGGTPGLWPLLLHQL